MSFTFRVSHANYLPVHVLKAGDVVCQYPADKDTPNMLHTIVCIDEHGKPDFYGYKDVTVIVQNNVTGQYKRLETYQGHSLVVVTVEENTI